MTSLFVNPYINKPDLIPFESCSFWSLTDFKFMQHALALAKQGASENEVPVGAVLVANDKIIGQGFNQPIASSDPTSHAEIVALRQACAQLNNYRLPENSTLYVTLEPCTMCIGALIHARLSRLIFATHEPRAGMVGSQLNLTNLPCYNHQIMTHSGLLKLQSQALLQQFFRKKRQKQKVTSAEYTCKN